ncbi:NPCBM/NEW2 domain-containing protein [Pendulispora brunnea]|uniref:Alpha-galactosidase n=1 Tax=Pendulispora brunnea TaxID=2905690 RepID=A0ABZ2JZN1_9BACT
MSTRTTIAAFLGLAAAALSPIPRAHAAKPSAPPMGWNHWNHFRCGIDEGIIKGIADAIVHTGLRDAGYRYVNVDDCWEEPVRDAHGHLQANAHTFPSGIAALADYVHARGLKFGIYTAAGDKTCEGRPGSGGHYAEDAATFAAWDVDYVKLDWCGAKGIPLELTKQFRAALDATGRAIVLGVSRHGSPWLWAEHPADLWRTSADIDDQWHSMLRNAEEEAGLSQRAGAGIGWNDPDMLQVGNGAMSPAEYRAHFSLWSILAAPLLLGNDIRAIDAETLRIVGEREVIAIDQDPLGRPGDRLRTDGDREVWTRHLAGGDVAVALFNRGVVATEIRTDAQEIGLPAGTGYQVRDVWGKRDFRSNGGISALVEPHGVALYRVSAAETSAPPLVTLASDARFFAPGETTQVIATLRTEQRLLHRVRIEVNAPPGWVVRPLGPAIPVSLPGWPASARFLVTAPANAAPGTARLSLSARDDSGESHAVQTVLVPPAAPAGRIALSNHPRLETDNGWYLPMKENHSFGPDDFCGNCQGGTLTLAGKSFDTGLGTYASSQVSYYLGGKCRSFHVIMGVDDEVLGITWPRPHNHVGTARFWIYADGRAVHDSGVRTAGGAPSSADIDLRGVQELKLINHSAGDGNFADHADWAGMRIVCAP